MRQIPLSHSLLAYLDELEFTEAALSADPETAALAPPFHEEIEGWGAVFQKERAARRAITRSSAAIAVRDAQLDLLTTRFGGAVLLESNQDRKSALFRRFFPVAPSEFVRQGLRKQCEQTRDRIVPELAKLADASPLKGYAEKLVTAVTAALESLDARAKAKGEASGASSDVDEWKEGINRLRTTTYAELIKLSAEKGYGRAWADTFFRAESDAGAEPDVSPSPSPA